MTQKYTIKNGERFDLELGGEIVRAGFSYVNGVPQLAYKPKTNLRPPVGLVIVLDQRRSFQVKAVEMSSYIQRMVLVTLEEVEADG